MGWLGQSSAAWATDMVVGAAKLIQAANIAIEKRGVIMSPKYVAFASRRIRRLVLPLALLRRKLRFGAILLPLP